MIRTKTVILRKPILTGEYIPPVVEPNGTRIDELAYDEMPRHEFEVITRGTDFPRQYIVVDNVIYMHGNINRSPLYLTRKYTSNGVQYFIPNECFWFRVDEIK